MVWLCGRRRGRRRRRYEIIKRKVDDLHQVLYVVYLYLPGSQRYFDELMTGVEGNMLCKVVSLTFTTPSNQIICFTSELWCSVSACPWSASEHRSIIRI